MKKIILLIVLTTQSILLATGGSIYSRYGLGEFHYNFSARRFGLGGFGFAIADKDFLSNTNPAGWNQLQLTRFNAGLLVDQIDASNSTNSVFNTNTYFNGVMLAFPVDREYGIGLAMGIVPFTNVNYDVVAKRTDPLVGDYTLNYKGEGGLSKLFVGSSYRLPFDVSLGLSLDYINGGINHVTGVSFAADTTYYDAGITQQVNYNGIGFTAGLISNDFSTLLGINELKDLRIGLVYSPSISLDADSVSIYNSLNGTLTTDTISIVSKLPNYFGVGLSFKLFERYQFVLDYMNQPLSKLEMGKSTFEYLQDVSKFSFGMEYKPDPRNQGFWQQIMLRGGVSFENSPYKLNGQSINQFSVYAGASLPIGYQSTIDLGFQYSKRGTTESNLVRENLYKFYITLSLGELWFVTSER